MGWSARADACDTFDAWARACVAQTGSSNVYEDARGVRYFFERGREQADGAITGRVFRFVGDDRAERAGGFRISPDGDVDRWPRGFKRFWQERGAFDARRVPRA